MAETNHDKRAEVAATVGFSAPSGAFRKDHLNAVLDYLDAEDALPVAEVYGDDAPLKRWFYRRVAEEAEFDYDPGDGTNARPYNSDELDALREAVRESVDASTAI